MTTILAFVVVLSLLVFVHELGHFLMAKKMGMKVEEFGFGFPPRLFGIQKDETIYSINWIPLGGFVKIKGESGEHANESDSFASKKAWQRLLVLVAGVVMNLVLAMVLLSIGFMIGLPSVVDDSLPSNAQVREEQIVIMEVAEGSPAVLAGVESGSSIVSLDGVVVTDDVQARDYIAAHGGEGVLFGIRTPQGEEMSYELTSAFVEAFEQEAIGISFVMTGLVSYPFVSAIVQGIGATFTLTWQIADAFVGIIASLIVSQEAGVDLSGPVGIAVMTGEVAALGFVYLLQFTAVLSINLAIINILPFPALDGGRVLFLVIEKLRGGKPVSEKVEGVVHNVGFALLIALVLLVTYKDVVGLFS